MDGNTSDEPDGLPRSEPDPSLAALATWRARIDMWIHLAGFLVTNVGVLAQIAGFVLAFFLGDPISGERCLNKGFWIAGLGAAAMFYGWEVDAGGSAKVQCGPVTYQPRSRRLPAALWGILGTPVWAVLSLPIGILLYGILVVGSVVIGVIHLAQFINTTRTGGSRTRPDRAGGPSETPPDSA